MQEKQVPSLVGELQSHILSRQLSTSTREPTRPKGEPVCHNWDPTQSHRKKEISDMIAAWLFVFAILPVLELHVLKLSY